MKEIKEVDISMNSRVFSINLAIKDEELIETIFSALREYVEKGFSIKVKETYVTSLSDSLKIITKIISSGSQMDEWRGET
ncbi:MAG: hypothetical protein HWN70_05420, partial [Desulfobacterales bacterium]|nr:hypothetical protein [Desulfobacterales bacterium]